MTDIANIVATERAIDILHPATEEPVGLSITLLPDSHHTVKAAARKALNERLSGKGKLTAERIEANRLDLLVASVGGWEWQGDLTFRGEKPDYNEANVRKVLKALPWIKNQIDKELGETEEFFRRDPDEAD